MGIFTKGNKELSEKELSKLSRAEVDTIATEKGIDPEQFANKDEAIEALLDEAPEATEDEATEDEVQEDVEASTELKDLQSAGHPVFFDASGNPIYK